MTPGVVDPERDDEHPNSDASSVIRRCPTEEGGFAQLTTPPAFTTEV